MQFFRRNAPLFWVTLVSLVLGGVVLLTVVRVGRETPVAPTAPQSRPQAVAGSPVPNCAVEFLISLPSPTPTPLATSSPRPSPSICPEFLDVMLVVDRSGTMNAQEFDGRKKLEWAKEAAQAFVDTMRAAAQPGQVRIGVASFGAQGNDGTGQLRVEYDSTLDHPLSADLNSVYTAVGAINYIRSGTCIECGLRIANNELLGNTRNARQIVILLSDGKANHLWDGSTPGPAASKQAAIDTANAGRGSGLIYYVVGYGQRELGQIDEATLIAIAGSESRYFYRPDVQEWASTFLELTNAICQPQPTPSPRPTPIPTPRPSPSPSPTPTPTPLPICVDIRVYQRDASGTLFRPELTTLQPGDTVYITVIGSGSGATNARFRIWGLPVGSANYQLLTDPPPSGDGWVEACTNPSDQNTCNILAPVNEYYYQFTLLPGYRSYRFESEIFYPGAGWR